jgi:uncharacterized protein
MRDGARLKADVFRPDDAGEFPAILNLGPYQKDKQRSMRGAPGRRWRSAGPAISRPAPRWLAGMRHSLSRIQTLGSGNR